MMEKHWGWANKFAGLLVLVTMTLTGCGGGGGGEPASPKTITAFVLGTAAGTINETNKTITVSVPLGTNLTNLIADYTTTGQTVSVNAANQISGITANNFTNPVAYTVTAADSTTVNYTVTVIKPFGTKQMGVAGASTYGHSTSTDASGNVYVAGVTWGGLDGNTLTGDQDFFLTKYDSNGTKQYTKQMGVAGTWTHGWSTSTDASGNVYVAGVTEGGWDGNTLTGTQDFFLTKYDSSGTKQ
jgi:hypothetical protein